MMHCDVLLYHTTPYVYVCISHLTLNMRPISLLTLHPTNIARLKSSGKFPYGTGNSTPLNQYCARVKPSETHNVSREIGCEHVASDIEHTRHQRRLVLHLAVQRGPSAGRLSLSLSLSIYIYIYTHIHVYYNMYMYVRTYIYIYI